jgi:hypothetical protein
MPSANVRSFVHANSVAQVITLPGATEREAAHNADICDSLTPDGDTVTRISALKPQADALLHLHRLQRHRGLAGRATSTALTTTRTQPLLASRKDAGEPQRNRLTSPSGARTTPLPDA